MRSPEEQTINEMIALLHDQPFAVSQDIFRNVQTLTRRYSNEGFSFITKTLPKLGKSFDQALSGNVAFTCATTFKSCGKSRFPHFLGSALRRVFDNDGILFEKPCYSTVKWLRTFLTYAYKIEVPFDENQLKQFEENFISVDTEIGNLQSCGLDSSLLRRMEHVLRGLPHKGSNPAHGPGISSNCKREEKYIQYVPSSALKSAFPLGFFEQTSEYKLEFSLNFLQSYFSAFFGLRIDFPGGFKPSKVLFVPKDSRGPRTICCEDSRYMFAQKSLQKELYSFIESSEEFGGRVNFTDQTINQRLTFDKSYATLDLKEASDRVSLDMVIGLFPPKLVAKMLACRSTHVTLPSGSVYELNKFAPMGSALCFPVMALISFASVVSKISLETGIPSSQVECYVYGDDIIVRNEHAHLAISGLESVGLLVNKGKSFINSRFTESCGQDTLDDQSVNALKKKRFLESVKRIRVKSKQVFDNVNGGIPHYVSLANQACSNGYKNLYRSLRDHVEVFHRFKIPYGIASSPYLNWHVDIKDVSVFNQHDGFEVNGKLRCVRVTDLPLKLRMNGQARLRRNLLEGGGEKPLNPLEIGARSTYLQPLTLVKWGETYS